MSKRSLLKFARDFAVAVGGFALAWLSAHVADLGLDPAVAALVAGPLSLLAFRLGRGAAGKEPAP